MRRATAAIRVTLNIRARSDVFVPFLYVERRVRHIRFKDTNLTVCGWGLPMLQRSMQRVQCGHLQRDVCLCLLGSCTE